MSFFRSRRKSTFVKAMRPDLFNVKSFALLGLGRSADLLDQLKERRILTWVVWKMRGLAGLCTQEQACCDVGAQALGL
jgi:hypothetical protein